ncbi:hypothetical protein AXK61_04675 [Tsukamurella pseudospumae]|uniref:NAD(P)-binding domain-containing protein n=1 Tax=Tsukamurella pseudospumae TaxID=239498 RepID=A0A137ZCM5_9ACTN|nr:hypothetical protein AXK61_04675 [Tsukamurella pseudospumae]
MTGATGTVGRRVVEQLIRAGAQVRATSRSTSNPLPGTGTILAAAPADDLLAGCIAAFVVTPALGPAPAERLRELVGAANEGTVERVVLLSTASASDPLSPTGAHHRVLEETAAEFAGALHLLRPVPFALNTIHWWSPTIRAAGFAEGPYIDVPMTPIDEVDVADVAARLLLSRDEPSGIVDLTGPQTLSSRAQIGVLARLLGTPIAVREITPEDVHSRLSAVGIPSAAVESLLRSFSLAAERPVRVSGAVERITGRPAHTYEQWAERNLDAFRWPMMEE